MSSGGCCVEGGGLLRGRYRSGCRRGMDINVPSCLCILESFISSKCLLVLCFSIHLSLWYILLCYSKIQNRNGQNAVLFSNCIYLPGYSVTVSPETPRAGNRSKSQTLLFESRHGNYPLIMTWTTLVCWQGALLSWSRAVVSCWNFLEKNFLYFLM